MKAFYKIVDSYPQVGQGLDIPDGFIEYTIGQEPKDLKNALDIEALKDAKQKAAQTIASNHKNAINGITGGVDSAEMASWTKQESEARAWVTDNNASTPIIDNLIIGRNMGENKADLVSKIIAKADAYAVAYAQLLGAYHAKQKAIEVATTVAEVEAV